MALEAALCELSPGETPAGAAAILHYGGMPGPNTMLYWLANTARQLREDKDRKQVHIAAALSTDQSSIYRFEQGKTWTRDPDRLVAAYADDLDIEDPREIWELALRRWREEGSAPSLEGLTDESLAEALSGEGRPASQPRAKPASGRRASRSRRATG
jgi:hypothetical protein